MVEEIGIHIPVIYRDQSGPYLVTRMGTIEHFLRRVPHRNALVAMRGLRSLNSWQRPKLVEYRLFDGQLWQLYNSRHGETETVNSLGVGEPAGVWGARKNVPNGFRSLQGIHHPFTSDDTHRFMGLHDIRFTAGEHDHPDFQARAHEARLRADRTLLIGDRLWHRSLGPVISLDRGARKTARQVTITDSAGALFRHRSLDGFWFPPNGDEVIETLREQGVTNITYDRQPLERLIPHDETRAIADVGVELAVLDVLADNRKTNLPRMDAHFLEAYVELRRIAERRWPRLQTHRKYDMIPFEHWNGREVPDATEYMPALSMLCSAARTSLPGGGLILEMARQALGQWYAPPELEGFRL